MLVLYLAALLTQGLPLPEQERASPPMTVIYQTAEDGLADTIKPRLKSAYDFGFSEEEMLDMMNGWWATDGNIYLSVSYYEGMVTIDHTKELPDLEGLLG